MVLGTLEMKVHLFSKTSQFQMLWKVIIYIPKAKDLAQSIFAVHAQCESNHRSLGVSGEICRRTR